MRPIPRRNDRRISVDAFLVEINIQIMRAFVRLRQLLSTHKELSDRLTTLERQMRERDQSVDQQFREVFALLEKLFTPAAPRSQADWRSRSRENRLRGSGSIFRPQTRLARPGYFQ